MSDWEIVEVAWVRGEVIILVENGVQETKYYRMDALDVMRRCVEVPLKETEEVR